MAIPKGSLEEATFALLGKAWTRVSRKNRTYRVFLDDSEIIVKMLRARDTMVAEGFYDIGVHALPKRANVASSRLPFGIAIRTFIYTNIISHTVFYGACRFRFYSCTYLF